METLQKRESPNYELLLNVRILWINLRSRETLLIRRLCHSSSYNKRVILLCGNYSYTVQWNPIISHYSFHYRRRSEDSFSVRALKLARLKSSSTRLSNFNVDSCVRGGCVDRRRVEHHLPLNFIIGSTAHRLILSPTSYKQLRIAFSKSYLVKSFKEKKNHERRKILIPKISIG